MERYGDDCWYNGSDWRFGIEFTCVIFNVVNFIILPVRR